MGDRSVHEGAAAQVLRARIALAARDAAGARAAAQLAQAVDPALPLYVDARLLFDQGKHGDALPLFQQAIAAVRGNRDLQIEELHLYAAETFLRLGRQREAEQEYLEELRYFPENARAHGALAALYHAAERPDEAAQTLDRMIQTVPTPDAYALAARLWTTFGDRRRAEAVRAEARRVLAPEPAGRSGQLGQH
jgi:tetratricopeptide (TPR) repeat protein